MQGVLLMAYSTSCLAVFFLQASITRVSLNFLQIRRSFLKASQDFDPPSQIKGFEGTQVSSDDPIVSLRDAALLQRSPRLCEYPWCAPGSLMRMTPQWLKPCTAHHPKALPRRRNSSSMWPRSCAHVKHSSYIHAFSCGPLCEVCPALKYCSCPVNTSTLALAII